MAPPSLIVVDGFLADPLLARQQALALDYDPGFKQGNYPGLQSTAPLVIPGLEEAVSKIAGISLKAQEGTIHGHCRITLAGDQGRSGVHIDPCAYSGILYLSLPQHCRGGTDFFRHKRTGLDRVPDRREDMLAAGYSDINLLIEDVVNRDTLKRGAWDKLMTLPMRFNRLVLFSPWQFHNSASGFGTGPANGRLVQTLFFAAA
ncbi:MAG: DUF6445 family protein [Novosphingobium sp.]